MPSHTPSPGRSRSRGRSRTPVSNARSGSPGRNQSPRSFRSGSRSRTPHSSQHEHGRSNGDQNGGRRSYSRSPSRSRSRGQARDARDAYHHSRSGSRNRNASRSRSRSITRSRSRTPATRSSKIVVEKLTRNVNADHLREIFGVYGEITDLDLPMNKQFNTNRGTAYIMFASIGDAEAAIAHMHEAQLDGAVINVSIVLPRRRFSVTPPPRRSGFMPRFESRTGPPGPSVNRGPPLATGVGRYRSPPRRRSPRGYGRGGRADTWTGRRSYTRSRSPRRSNRSRSYTSRSRTRSRSPPRRGGGYRGRESPPRGVGRRRRSPSYSSYSSYSERSRSRSRDRGGRRR